MQIKEQEAAESVACQEISDGNKATVGGPEQPPSPPDNDDNAITQLQERLLRSTAQTASLKAEYATSLCLANISMLTLCLRMNM
jgi:hypothetical protein